MKPPKEILDPNAVPASVGPWNAALPVRRWVDKRASDPKNSDDEFSYLKVVVINGVVRLRSFTLGSEEAAVANIPPADATSVLAELDLPVRQLLPSEVLGTDTFGQITYQDLGKGPATGAAAEKLEKILRAIATKVGADLTGI